MKEIKINVNGMVCGGCEKRVINAVSELKGVQEVKADHNEGIVLVKTEENVNENTIKETIEDIGFEVEQ